MPDTAQPPETAFPAERYVTIARQLGRELGQPVTRGTVRGALALASSSRAGAPDTLTRSEMLALLRKYLRTDA